MKNIPDSIQTIVDLITSTMKPNSIVNSGSYTVVDIGTSNDPGMAVGMYVEFNGYPLRKQIISISGTEITIERYTALEGSTTNFNILLNYYFGNSKEILSRVVEMNKDSDQNKKRWPLLALYIEPAIYEDRGKNKLFDFETNIDLVFIIDANKVWKPSDRLTTSFKLKLYPYYELFLEKSLLNFGTDEHGLIPHKKGDIYFSSADAAAKQNTLSAFVDALEIKDFELKTYYTGNC